MSIFDWISLRLAQLKTSDIIPGNEARMPIHPQSTAAIASLFVILCGDCVEAQIHSADNGVYGGYVASDAWFDAMRRKAGRGGSTAHAQWQAARNEALRSGTSTEVALIVSFPTGNPFPKGRVPNLTVLGPDGKDTGAYPYTSKSVTNQAAYYLLIPKGADYTLQWLYFAGSKEVFAKFRVPDSAPQRMAVLIPYRAPGLQNSETSRVSTATVLLRSDKGFVAPQSDNAFSPPRSEDEVHQPKSDGKFVAPKSDSSFQTPKPDGGWSPPNSDSNYKSPK